MLLLIHRRHVSKVSCACSGCCEGDDLTGSQSRCSPAAIAVGGCDGGLLLLLAQPQGGQRGCEIRLRGAAQLVCRRGHLRLRQLS